jgi:hypothetical protein
MPAKKQARLAAGTKNKAKKPTAVSKKNIAVRSAAKATKKTKAKAKDGFLPTKDHGFNFLMRKQPLRSVDIPAEYISALLVGETHSPFSWESNIACFLTNGQKNIVFVSSTGNLSIAVRVVVERALPTHEICQKDGLFLFIRKETITEYPKRVGRLKFVKFICSHYGYALIPSSDEVSCLGKAGKGTYSLRANGTLANGCRARRGSAPIKWFPLAYRLNVRGLDSTGVLPAVHPDSEKDLDFVAKTINARPIIVPDYHSGVGIVSFVRVEDGQATKLNDIVAFVKLQVQSSGLVAHPFAPDWIRFDLENA